MSGLPFILGGVATFAAFASAITYLHEHARGPFANRGEVMPATPALPEGTDLLKVGVVVRLDNLSDPEVRASYAKQFAEAAEKAMRSRAGIA